jgi:hypothetical protein
MRPSGHFDALLTLVVRRFEVSSKKLASLSRSASEMGK